MEKEKQIFKNLEKQVNKKNLILFNDHHNTFEHVINTLVDICEHDPFQAEQCAMVVHHKGKCAVKSGNYEELEVIGKEMGNRDLTVEIQ